MRKIVHYVKEYDPKVKLLCGCRDGFIQHPGDEVTCKRCIKSLKARGQPFRKQKKFRNPLQMDLFGHRERFMGVKTKIGKLVAMGVAWLKSKFGVKKPYFEDGVVYVVPEHMEILNVTMSGGAGDGGIQDFSKEIELMGKAGKAAGERNVQTVMEIMDREEHSEDGSLARP